MRLGGKVAIITGASRGIGRAVAERFAAEGASLLLAYKSSQAQMAEVAELCSASGAEVQTAAADLTDKVAADQLFAEAISRFGTVDILVHSAAIARDDLIAVVGDDAIDELIRTNVIAAVALTRAAIRAMLRRRAGVILHMSSVTASKPGRGGSVYAGTKGFIESFSRAVAAEVARKGIRVNAIAPGVIETDMNASLRAMAGPELLGKVAQRRFGRPEEVAAVAAWLASDEAAYVNGAVIAVDGGFGLGA